MVEAVVRDSTLAPLKPVDFAERVSRYRNSIDVIRVQVRDRFEHGATGAQTAGMQSQLFDQFVIRVLTESLQQLEPDLRGSIESHSAVLAVGGTGRGEMCPYSDLDLLFLSTPEISEQFESFAAQVQRDLWDSGLKLGASVRTVSDALLWAKQEPQFATSLVDARPLWGATSLGEHLLAQFRRSVMTYSRDFISTAIASRTKECEEQSATTQQLEPDVKRSLGALRDLHLIRWIGFAAHGAGDVDSLRLKGALSKEEARRLVHAHEFFTALRIDLHLNAGKEHDVLSREDQLRIARKRAIPASGGQSSVERFMQEYFQHSTTVASITRRFTSSVRHVKWSERLLLNLVAFRIDDIYYVGPETLDVARRHRQSVCSSIESVLRMFLTAARCRVRVAQPLLDCIKAQHLTPPVQLSEEAAQLFLSLLKTPGKLGVALRDLHETGTLEVVLPCWQHIRCLLQFNQYHHFTVDEHTLRAVEAAERFESDQSAIGKAYREIHHKELLHLALLLHDAGKGYEEDHSEVGRRLALEMSMRLGLPDHQRELVMLLVHRHLYMADIALRRDIGDSALLLRFSHEVGSLDALRMLFVLTAADISAVGPGTWNQWKAELTITLYERATLWLSGKSYLFDESTRLKQIEQQVQVQYQTIPVAKSPQLESIDDTKPLAEQLNRCPTHYLLETPPERIAADFRIIDGRRPDDIHVEATYDSETGTVEYRIVLHEDVASGCFHKLAGALSAKRLEILSAAICTTQDGIIIDAFRVRDADHADEIPQFRIDDVAMAIRKVLRSETDVETLLKGRGRFAMNSPTGPVSNLPLRVVIDNESSDRHTIIDVFAHDRPGLLYAIARAVYELKLSVTQAKIATHFDQVLDIFFVTDLSGHKVQDGTRLTAIREHLLKSLGKFETLGREETAS